MGGLVGYESSDEDEDVQESAQTKIKIDEQHVGYRPESSIENGVNASRVAQSEPEGRTTSPESSGADKLGPVQGPTPGPSLGPAIGPALGPSLLDTDRGDTAASPSAQLRDQTDPPRSPYSTTRSLIHDLTLPTVPDTAIPPSPPGSPPRALTAKFDNFLALKQTKAIHFNARLAGSTAARNPALMDKLLGFVGVETSFDEEGRSGAGGGPEQQYATTLPADVWDPAALPAWAYKTPLRRAQERAAKERERGRGQPVEFVPAAGGTGSASESRSGTPGMAGVPTAVTGKRKTRFDT